MRVFLAFILSKMAQNRTELISERSSMTLGVRMLRTPGEPK